MSNTLILNCRGKILDFNTHTHIMGVINCTPDSFYEGSRQPTVENAIEAGIRMVAKGADILDVGGESTRPGSEPVSEENESKRILPVIEALVDAVDVPISVDTYKAGVAARALEAGAHIVNDISALSFDPNMASVAAQFDVPVILMHIKGTPKNMQKNPYYDDVVDEIYQYFEERIDYAIKQGIGLANIVIDPGIGFGKRLQDNYEILQRLDAFRNLNRPILVGPSRKSFLGKVLNLPPEDCIEGTLAAATASIMAGADILRVHDVKEMKRAAQIADAIVGKTPVAH